MKYIIIICMICFFLCMNFANNSFGYNTEYQIKGRQFSDNPLVCTYEPTVKQDTYLKQWGINRLLESSRLSVQDWQSALQQNEKRTFRDNWRIDYKVITETDDTQKCNIIIKFNAIPFDKNEWYRTLGVTHYNYNNTDVKLIDIYYRDVKICQTSDEHYIYYKPCYGEDMLLEEKLRTTITHEIGHALGLGHYQADDPKVNAVWAKGGADAESIMAVFSHENSKLMKIKPIDIEKIKTMYTPTGFKIKSQESTTQEMSQMNFTIPNWVKTNAKWWSNSNIDDQTFVKGIEFLVNNQIIKTSSVSQTTKNAIVPQWIKNNAKWWSDGEITDMEFLKSMEFLIQQGIVKISP